MLIQIDHWVNNSFQIFSKIYSRHQQRHKTSIYNFKIAAYFFKDVAHSLRNLLTLGEITTWQYACSGCREK